jgi:hypothetical protein
MKPLFYALTALIASLGTACESIESSDIRTSGVYANFEAKANGEGATLISASLTVGENSNTYLDLVEGDTLQASFEDETTTMERNNLGTMVWYETTFPTDAKDSTFTLSFQREEDDSAPNSSVSLPAPFEITVPSQGDSFSMSADKIDIAWNNSDTDDEMQIIISGDCFYGQNISVENDPGVYIVEQAILEPIDDQDTCTGTLTIIRKRLGTIDINYGEGGEIQGLQVRHLTLNLHP